MSDPFDYTNDPNAPGYVAPVQPTGPATIGGTGVDYAGPGIYTFSVYNSLTGYFYGQTVVGSLAIVADLDALDPIASMIIGEYDRDWQRVNLTTGLVEAYIPDQPTPADGVGTYVWNPATHKWELTLGYWEIYAQTQEALLIELRETHEYYSKLSAAIFSLPTEVSSDVILPAAQAFIAAWILDNNLTTTSSVELNAYTDAQFPPAGAYWYSQGMNRVKVCAENIIGADGEYKRIQLLLTLTRAKYQMQVQGVNNVPDMLAARTAWRLAYPLLF